ncbi:MAG: UvrD-helicase domain-containing protein [Bacteroidales bacterium]|nr:UvrD-helicase domain-containing protein [Bacteroidales bacterium]
MKFIGDFHLHSHYSLATSKELRPDFLDYWARLKGIKVIGSGDFTHPGWLQELQDQLEPAEEGLFKLKKENKKKISPPVEEDASFILTAEISNIYKKKGEVRKVHNVVFAPSFSVVEKIQNKLAIHGFNITSDGRPIIGMDSRDLLELCLEASEDIFFVPAHIWTPWFSVLGSKSGFDTVNECYEDLSAYITAVEMGLSTDPPMNWMCSFLDTYTLIANSDAHSPEKLGRNANIFETDLSYNGIIDAMKSGNQENFLGTINFFPQEGKYHYDGHRKCGIRWSPIDTLQHDEICPICGKKITVGVMNRIAQLANRDNIIERPNRHPFYSLIPLKEILSEIEGVSPDSNKVDQHYKQLVHKAGSEFNILLHFDLNHVKTIGGELLCEAVRRMRNREVHIQEGFDGEFGIIKVFREGETRSLNHSESLFKESESRYFVVNAPCPLVSFDLEAFRKLKQQKPLTEAEETGSFKPEILTGERPAGLNNEQTESAEHFSGPAIILAGPGTGKTQVLTTRIAFLIQKRNINPGSILAITFTNKAAREMKERLALMLDSQILNDLRIYTFHSFGLSIIKEYLKNSGVTDYLTVIDEDDKRQILSEINVDKSIIAKTSEKISEIKQSLISENQVADTVLAKIFNKYNHIMRQSNAYDFDDLVSFPVQIFQKHPDILYEYQRKTEWILVDEYQDINLPQYMMIRMLMSEPDSNLFVIGDPDQAIYGFRGADVRYIQMFRDDYKDAAVFKLKKSYRCTDSILKASGNVLKTNQKFLEGVQRGVRIKISENAIDKSEAEFVARKIEKMIGGMGFFSIDSQVAEGTKDEGIESLSDFAVLCRISRQMPPIEKALRDHNIPYQKIGEDSILKQEPVKTILDVYRFTSNPGNTFLKSRLVKQKIISEKGLMQLVEMIADKNLVEKLEFIVSNYFRNHIEEHKFMITFLIDIAEQYESNEEDFLQHILLGTGIDSWKPKVEAVNLMTIHASKGLEFNCVFITGCEENLMPYSLFEEQHADPEEERRLLYVGMTRAKNYLFLTSAQQRFLMGREYFQKRSHFLEEIEKELIETEVPQTKIKEKKDREQLKLF